MAKVTIEQDKPIDIDDLFNGFLADDTRSEMIVECMKRALGNAALRAKQLQSPSAESVHVLEQYEDENGKKHWREYDKPHQPNYIDRTGNLRSSIGFVIYENGQVRDEVFSGTAEGTQKGAEVANEVASKEGDGIVGVITAGMDYALAVESKGYDVLTGPVQKLKEEFEQYLKEAKNG